MSASLPKRRALERDDAPAPGDGATRVRLRFLPDGAEVRVPSGTPIFDAASWNGIAIDSTCGGHGTCKKCKVRIVSGEVPIGTIDPRAFSTDELRDGWRLACRAGARSDLVVEVPPLQTRPKAALVGVGRHVILRPSVQKRHLVLEEPTLEDQRPDLQRVLDALEDLEPHADQEPAGAHLADLVGDAVEAGHGEQQSGHERDEDRERDQPMPKAPRGLGRVELCSLIDARIVGPHG